MNVKIISFFLFLMIVSSYTNGQNSIATLLINHEEVDEGFTLFYPEYQRDIFLINNCGQLIHKWQGANTQGPGKEAYLLPNGNLIKASAEGNGAYSSFGTGGAGGVIEILDWDSNVLKRKIFADESIRQHHDIYPMENGNVLLIAWEKKILSEIVEVGFDTLSNNQVELWPDMVLEYDFNKDSIVWEWHTWDHMVQDFDSTKLMYGSVVAHPELLDVNYQEYTFQRQDIHHINSIDYEPDLDLILLSARNFNEIWIIDHSTTTEESAGHSGGNFGRGGDILYRWGNPQAYKQGNEDDLHLSRPHNVRFLDYLPTNDSLHGKISIFNNFVDNERSLVHVIAPVLDTSNFKFVLVDNEYLPNTFYAEFSNQDTTKNFSSAGSSAQFLDNGNVLICAARQGRFTEIDRHGNLLWEYFVPFRNGFPVHQGEDVSISQNFTFTAKKYPSDFPAFQDKDISPKGYIELSPNEDFCKILGYSGESNNTIGEITIFPNPTTGLLYIESKEPTNISLYDVYGNFVMSTSFYNGANELDLSYLNNGVYILALDANSTYHKIIIAH